MIIKPPVVSSYLLTPCSKLVPPEDGKFATIAGKLVETVGEYKKCSLKQQALIDTVNKLNKYIKGNKK